MKSNAIVGAIFSAATSNTAIYWACAFYVMCAMQWQPLWGLGPFIIGALVHRFHRKRHGASNRERLPAALSETSNAAPAIAGLPMIALDPQPTAPSPTASPAPQGVVDPFVNMPSIFQKVTDWNQFTPPAWQRKGVDISAELKDVIPSKTTDAQAPTFLFVEIPDHINEIEIANSEGTDGSFLYS
jgi:hypothetical protein